MGQRTTAYLAGGRVKLVSRKGRDDTQAYFDVADQLSTIKVKRAILDGEVVVMDAADDPTSVCSSVGSTSPSLVTSSAARTYPAQLMLFDILELNGQSSIKKTYQERPGDPGKPDTRRAWFTDQVPPIFEGDLRAALETADQLRLGGVVAKRRNSIYQPGRRTHTWRQVDCTTPRRS